MSSTFPSAGTQTLPKSVFLNMALSPLRGWACQPTESQFPNIVVKTPQSNVYQSLETVLISADALPNSNWYFNQGSWYTLSNTKLRSGDAGEFCENSGAKPVKLQTQEENRFLVLLLAGRSLAGGVVLPEYFIGKN